jgi:hypothetical protein
MPTAVQIRAITQDVGAVTRAHQACSRGRGFSVVVRAATLPISFPRLAGAKWYVHARQCTIPP